MPRVWRKLRSFFKATPIAAANGVNHAGSGRIAHPSPLSAVVPVVALIVNDEDRREVTRICRASISSTGRSTANTGIPSISGKDGWEVHFAESHEQALDFARRLSAPVILVDRDWPGMEWRTAVESLAALPHHACVILVSGVADGYLWQEVVRRDGYDILAKPLLADNVLRAISLALSYWSIRASGHRRGPSAKEVNDVAR
jgi:CheY-like chemotaxis protein